MENCDPVDSVGFQSSGEAAAHVAVCPWLCPSVICFLFYSAQCGLFCCDLMPSHPTSSVCVQNPS